MLAMKSLKNPFLAKKHFKPKIKIYIGSHSNRDGTVFYEAEHLCFIKLQTASKTRFLVKNFWVKFG